MHYALCIVHWVVCTLCTVHCVVFALLCTVGQPGVYRCHYNRAAALNWSRTGGLISQSLEAVDGFLVGWKAWLIGAIDTHGIWHNWIF